MEKQRCVKCKEMKDLEAFKGGIRARKWMTKSGIVERREAGKAKKNFWICSRCDNPLLPERVAEKLYASIKATQKRNYGTDLAFSFFEFWEWLLKSGFETMLKAVPPKDCSNTMARLSIDRINSWLDYRLDNMQILPRGENASKGSGPAIAARLLTMRFFEKLRAKKGLTKYEFARFLGILPQTYYYLEDKARGCSFEILCLIREKMGLSWDELGRLVDNEVKHNAKAEK
jgi:hypothetical protein